MGKSVISQEGMQKALSWAWDKSLNGIPGTGTAEELAESYLSGKDSVENAIDELIYMAVQKVWHIWLYDWPWWAGDITCSHSCKYY